MQGGVSSISGSGILVGHGLYRSRRLHFILSSASLLYPFLRRSESPASLCGTSSPEGALAPHSAVEVILPSATWPPPSAADVVEQWRRAHVVCVGSDADAQAAVEAITKRDLSWSVSWSEKPEPGADMTVEVLTQVMLLCVDENEGDPDGGGDEERLDGRTIRKIAVSALERVIAHADTGLQVGKVSVEHSCGRDVLAVGSPFGATAPLSFFNCCTRGIVCGVLQKPGSDTTAVVVHDTKCMSGMEGGGLYDVESGKLVGMVQPPLRTTSDRTVLQVALPITVILQHVLQRLRGAPGGPQELPQAAASSNDAAHAGSTWSPVIEKAAKSLALVKMGLHWASGVMISDRGHILTNAHLLKPFMNDGDGTNLQPHARVVALSSRWMSCRVIFVSMSPWDIALLQFNEINTSIHPVRIATSVPPVGSEVVALGHGVFGPAARLQPFATKGILGSITSVRGEPCMLQTDAPIHKGNSGGMILNADGEFTSLVVCNARDTNQYTIPRLNFSIPTVALRGLWQYIEHGREGPLHQLLNDERSDVRDVWDLRYGAEPPKSFPLPPRLRRLLEERTDKEARGEQPMHRAKL